VRREKRAGRRRRGRPAERLLEGDLLLLCGRVGLLVLRLLLVGLGLGRFLGIRFRLGLGGVLSVGLLFGLASGLASASGFFSGSGFASSWALRRRGLAFLGGGFGLFGRG
jgi:hypothetical protein